jgi:hypothetical protein
MEELKTRFDLNCSTWKIVVRGKEKEEEKGDAYHHLLFYTQWTRK